MMPMRQIGIICDRLEMPSGSRGRLTYPAAVREHRIPAGDDLPRVFTPRQCNGIRKVARRFGYPRDQWWDFVHETWLKVAVAWCRVPPAKRIYQRVSRLEEKLAELEPPVSSPAPASALTPCLAPTLPVG
jgi:hypothetical protein